MNKYYKKETSFSFLFFLNFLFFFSFLFFPSQSYRSQCFSSFFFLWRPAKTTGKKKRMFSLFLLHYGTEQKWVFCDSYQGSFFMDITWKLRENKFFLQKELPFWEMLTIKCFMKQINNFQEEKDKYMKK